MKIINNIDLALSLNKGKKDILFESLKEVQAHFELNEYIIKDLKSLKKDSNVIGYVKSYSFDKENNDFVPVYKKEIDLGYFNVIHEDVRYYSGLLVIISKESDFRSKMIKIDQGNDIGCLKFNDF